MRVKLLCKITYIYIIFPQKLLMSKNYCIHNKKNINFWCYQHIFRISTDIYALYINRNLKIPHIYVSSISLNISVYLTTRPNKAKKKKKRKKKKKIVIKKFGVYQTKTVKKFMYLLQY